MKWRLTFGDPMTSAHKRNVRNGQRVEIPADAEGGLMGVDAAVAKAVDQRRIHHVGWTLLEAVLVPDDDVVIDWMIPYPLTRLTFDPTRIEDPTLQRVWQDPLARTIWLAVKYMHLTDQYFTRECLTAARAIRRYCPEDAHQLRLAMEHSMPSNARGISEPFWSQFFPYVLGKKQIGFVYEEPKAVAVPAL